MTSRALRAVPLVVGAVVLALTALHAWSTARPFDEEAASAEASSLPSAIVEEKRDTLNANRGGSDVGGYADDGWRRVASRFASALANFDGDQEEWHHQLRRWTTPSLAEAYSHSDARLLPSGPPTSLSVVAEGVGVVDVLVGFNGGATAIVRLEMTGRRGWLISAVEKG